MKVESKGEKGVKKAEKEREEDTGSGQEQEGEKDRWLEGEKEKGGREVLRETVTERGLLL